MSGCRSSCFAGDASVSDGKLSPLVARNARASGEGQKIVVSVCVASRCECNGAKGTRLGSVGRVRRFEDLDVLTKFDTHVVVVRRRGTGNERKRTGIRRNTVGPRKLVEAPDRVRDNAHNKKLRNALERQAVDGGAESLFDSLDGPLDFADVTIGRDNVHVDQVDIFPDAFKFVVGVNVNDNKTAGAAKVDHKVELAKDGAVRSVRDGSDGTKTDVPQNGMKERVPLSKEKIHAERDPLMVCKDTWRNGNGVVGGDPRGSAVLRHFSFQRRHVGTVNDQSPLCVIGCDGAVLEIVSPK